MKYPYYFEAHFWQYDNEVLLKRDSTWRWGYTQNEGVVYCHHYNDHMITWRFNK